MKANWGWVTFPFSFGPINHRTKYEHPNVLFMGVRLRLPLPSSGFQIFLIIRKLSYFTYAWTHWI